MQKEKSARPKTKVRAKSKFKKRLILRSIIPSSSPYTKVHEKILDMLKAEMYVDLKQYVKEVLGIDLNERYKPERTIVKVRKVKEKKDPVLAARERVVQKLIEFDLTCMDDESATDIQKEIKHRVMTEGLNVRQVIDEYVDYANIACKQKYMYDRLRSSYKTREDKGLTFNINPEDIMISEYCPFLGTKLVYKKTKCGLTDNYASNDRFHNHLGYVKGNVWIISKLANTMKNSSTTEELKTFCINVIKMYHEDNSNKGL